jgi:hypothetical protein
MWPADGAGPATAGRKSLIYFHDTYPRPRAMDRLDCHGAYRACGKGDRVRGDAGVVLDVM